MNLPQDLLDSAGNGKLVLFIGAGMSQAAGLPGWSGLLEQGLDYAKRQAIRIEAEAIRGLLAGEGKDLLLAAHQLRKELKDRNFYAFLRDLCLNDRIRPTAAHKLLQDIPCAGILTTNYDQLIERSFPPATPMHTHRDGAELAAMNRDGHFAIVKVHGDVYQGETLILGQEDYRKAIFGGEGFRQYFEALAQTRTILFLGCSLTDPDILLFLDELNFKSGGHAGSHFALMRIQGESQIRLKNFEDRYGIRIIGDPERAERPDIEGLLRQLRGSRIPQPQMDDIRNLIEEGGSKVTAEDAGLFGRFDATYAVRGRQKKICFCYFPQALQAQDVTAFRQRTEAGVEHVLISREEPGIRPEGLEIYSRDEMIGNLADFSDYLTRSRKEYEASDIPRYAVPLKLKDVDRELDDVLDEWLLAPGLNHLSLLGTFGTGKTWFSRRLADRWSRRPGRIPILFPLRDYAKAYDIEQLITDAVQNRFEVALPAAFRTFQRMNNEGRLVLIFDGFDEMDRRTGDYKTTVENFWQIARLAGPKSKVVLTCREEFFRHDQEVREAHGVIQIEGRPNYEVLTLAAFDDAQILAALRLRQPEKADALFERIKGIKRLEEMAHRPVLLDMIAATLPHLKDADQINLAKLYEQYTRDLMRRRDFDHSLSEDERRAFAQDLAWEMHNENRKSVPFSEFPERVTQRFGLQNDPNKAAHFEQDLRTQSYLDRDGAGNYKFAHLSMQEYFVALRVEKILRGEPGEKLRFLTDAVVGFLPDLLADYVYPVELSADGRMVKVPAGPFIYGAESEGNLRLATIDQPFWIDRYPVTNAEYAEFLNARGSQGGGEWIDLSDDSCRIAIGGDGCVVKDGWHDHPVTQVSWYGAQEYAIWAKKTLPNEEQWEKAARGIDGREYPFGDWDTAPCNTIEKGPRRTTPYQYYQEVGESPYGCWDLAGNVWEWMENWIENWLGREKVLRGGSWSFPKYRARSACRDDLPPGYRGQGVGFRCVRAT